MAFRPLVRLVFFGFTVVVLLYVCCIGIKNVFRYNSFKLTQAHTQAVLDRVQLRNSRLKQQMQAMEADHYWELTIKERLGWVKQGEIDYRILPKKGQ